MKVNLTFRLFTNLRFQSVRLLLLNKPQARIPHIIVSFYLKMSNPNEEAQQNQRQQVADRRAEFMNYKFTPEEQRVIDQCQSESFYQRSLPFGLAFGSAAFMCVKNGILKGNARFGPWPKVLGFAFIGHLVGKLSYMKTYEERLMALPNSRFAEMLRANALRKKGIRVDDSYDAGALPFQSQSDSYTDEYKQPSSLNLDTDRPYYSGLNESFQTTTGGANSMNEDPVILNPRSNITYDALRQKNRDDFNRQPNSYNQPPNADSPSNPQVESYNPTPADNRRRRTNLQNKNDGEPSGPKNKYGDIWSE